MKREPDQMSTPAAGTVQDRAVPTFVQIIARPLLVRLAAEFRDAVSEFLRQPALYLRSTFMPDKLSHWFPARFLREVCDVVRALVRHPLGTVVGALTPDEIGRKRRKTLTIALSMSWVVHGALIVYLVYAAIVAPFANFRIVEKPYTIDSSQYLKDLYYPRQMLIAMAPKTPDSLDNIKKRDAERRRREEELRKKREEEEKRKEALAKQKAEEEKKKAELAAADAAKKAEPPKTFGEVNINPIKDIIGNLYQMYQSGNLDVPANGFRIMCDFKIAKDGSIPGDSVHVIHSSGSNVVDTNAVQILLRLGESRALGPLSTLSSNTIELDLNDKVAKVTITSFAQTPEDAKAKVQSLNFLLGILKVAQKSKNPMVAELLDHLKLTCDNKRINADMTVPKSRATVMMEKQFGKGNQPQ